MEEFKYNFESLINQLDDNYNLSDLLDFCTYFRCDDVSLLKEYQKGLKKYGLYDGYYPTDNLINLYCKKNNIALSDENSSIIFNGLLDNIWNNNMSYHITTSVSAQNIAEHGMNPALKEDDVIDDITSAMDSLSLDTKKLFFPYFEGDKNYYSYSSIPEFNNSYGKTPEWFLNLTGYNSKDLDKSLNYVVSNMSGESEEAKEKMYNLVSKYHEIYKDSTRTLVVIPGLNQKCTNEIFDVDSIEKLKGCVSYLMRARSSNIDGKTNQVIPSSELMFIDISNKKVVEFSNQTKKV